MTLDPYPSDAELLRRLEEKTGMKVKLDPSMPPDRIVVAQPYGIAGPMLPVTLIEHTLKKVHKPKAMNKTEAWRDAQLKDLWRKSAVRWYGFGAITLKLANDLRYTPDFAVLYAGGSLEFEEVKGPHWRDDARAKIKMAAKQFPFWTFKSFQRVTSFSQFDGDWYIEHFRGE